MTTLEDFFLKDYEKQRERIAELESKIATPGNQGYGCFDLHQPVETVTVSVEPSYHFDDDYFKAEDLKAAAKMDDAQLFEWGTRRHHGKDYYSCTPIKIERKTYYYSLHFIETHRDEILVTNGAQDDGLVSIEWEGEAGDNLGLVCMACRFEDLKDAAICNLREKIEAELNKRGM